SHLDPFVVATGDAAPRDQRDLMERPFFSLGKRPRMKPILYKGADIEVQVFAMPEHGMATIWDADVLIWAASQIVAAENSGIPTSRFFRFTPNQMLRAIGRPTGSHQYQLLKAALARLQSTVVATTIRNGPNWRRRQFSWINEWAEMATRSGRVEGIEFVLPEWFYQSVIDHSLVLAIDPAYFRLTGGIELWLYRVARKLPDTSQRAELSRSATFTKSLASSRGRPTSRLTCAGAWPASHCPDTVSKSSGRTGANYCVFSPKTYPQCLWVTMWKLSAD